MRPDTQSTVQLTWDIRDAARLCTRRVRAATCVIISDQMSWALGQAGVCAVPTSV